MGRDEAAPGGKNISRNWRSGCANANSRASKPRARFRERRGKSQKRTRDYERSYHSKALGRTASKYICKHPQRAIRKWEVNMEGRASSSTIAPDTQTMLHGWKQAYWGRRTIFR